MDVGRLDRILKVRRIITSFTSSSFTASSVHRAKLITPVEMRGRYSRYSHILLLKLYRGTEANMEADGLGNYPDTG
jgi:hypothetical protein